MTEKNIKKKIKHTTKVMTKINLTNNLNYIQLSSSC